MSVSKAHLFIVTILSAFILVTLATPLQASEPIGKSSGQTVYVPVYSHVYVGSKGQEFQLAATLYIRNANLDKAIKLESAGYYDSSGKLIRQVLKAPTKIDPLASTQFFVGESDTTGGLGAFFLVRWSSETKVNEPIIEVVNVGTRSGQGISFVSTGKVVD